MTTIVEGDAVDWETTPAAWEASKVRWRDLIGRAGASEIIDGPQAFIVDYTTNYVLDAHFHEVPQFQIFYRGDAMLGKTEVDPVTVYYSDEYTPYGPIKCGDSGLAFFNLRPSAALGANYMPGAREKLIQRPGRHRAAHVAVTDPSAIDELQRNVVVEPEDDGLQAFDVVAGPGRQIDGEIAGGSGRYELVLAGSMEVDGRTLPVESIIFTPAGERSPDRTAGADGVQFLELQSAPLS
jgi:hypothetical protein